MEFYADLHIHSRYSRATSAQCDLEHLSLWANKKGIRVIGTGDFTHPVWRQELEEKLTPAELGLYRMRTEMMPDGAFRRPDDEIGGPRFLLSAEISTIYKKGGATRKVHHCLFAPDFASVDRISGRLEPIGSLHSDGRPILRLDSRDLLEIVLEAGPGCFLVPAHIWTPWYSVLGSRSGFDSVQECYGDLSGEVFALETGLSSDPPMNWRISALDRFRLISCSDAHSPRNLGREACVFSTDLDYFAMLRALEEGIGYGGTVEFYPEEGKYHLDGHRRCGIRLTPKETQRCGGRCPVCGKAVTVGVMHRVEELADRPVGAVAPTAGTVVSLIPLAEILAEILGVSSKSGRVWREYDKLVEAVGPELDLLTRVPVEEIERKGWPHLAEALLRLRRGEVIREAGYDGEYGTIRLFEPGELADRVPGGVRKRAAPCV
ncbi:MAG: hypothetical protein JW797_09380 [Bradymonadales bacterium]|nr:hypothetical protein [Bradymonadales bacterium]